MQLVDLTRCGRNSIKHAAKDRGCRSQLVDRWGPTAWRQISYPQLHEVVGSEMHVASLEKSAYSFSMPSASRVETRRCNEVALMVSFLGAVSSFGVRSLWISI
jgi:hypothetical protein